MGLNEEIFLRADYEEFFRSLGLLNYDSFLTFERGEEVSEVRDRIVFRFRPEAKGDAFFLKIYRQPGANRPLSQCLQMQRPMTLAKLEAWNLQWLEDRGFIAPKVLAWGGRMNGWSEVNSFLVTEEMVGFEPFDEWLERNKSALPGKEFQRIKRAMIDRCAEALADLHGQGFHHPFPYLRHFFVPVEPPTPSEPLPLAPSPPCGEGELPPPRVAGRGLGGGVPEIGGGVSEIRGGVPEIQVGIIDVDSAKISKTVSPRDRTRGLAELFLSSFNSPLNQTDRLRFFRTYCGGRVDRDLASRVLKRFRQKLRRHPNRYAWVKEAVSRIPYPSALKDSISD